MEGFTIVDAVVAVIILVSAILAYSRGLVREVLAIGGWIAAAVAAFYLTPMAAPLVLEIPVLSDFLADSCELTVLAAFAIVFVIALLVVSIFIPLFSGAVQRSAIGGIDQTLGFLFGVLRGALLVVVVLIVYDRVLVGDPMPAIDNSRSSLIFAEVQDRLAAAIPEDAPGWIVGRYEALVGDCGAPTRPVDADAAPDAVPEASPEAAPGDATPEDTDAPAN